MTVDEYVKEYEVDAEFLPKNEVLYRFTDELEIQCYRVVSPRVVRNMIKDLKRVDRPRGCNVYIRFSKVRVL